MCVLLKKELWTCAGVSEPRIGSVLWGATVVPEGVAIIEAGR